MSLQWGNGKENKFWESDPECSHYRTGFVVRGSLLPRALVSFPGSGNTWTRYLMEAATGVFTGSVFNDIRLVRAGHHGETRGYNDGSTLLQKTHHNTFYKNGLEWRRDHIRQFGGRLVHLDVEDQVEELLRQLSYAIKNQLVASKAPY